MILTSITSSLLEQLIAFANEQIINQPVLSAYRFSEFDYYFIFPKTNLNICLFPEFPHFRLENETTNNEQIFDPINLKLLEKNLLLKIDCASTLGLITFHFENDYALHLELRGNRSNLILTINNLIEGAHRSENSSIRVIARDFDYAMPPIQRLPAGKYYDDNPNQRAKELYQSALQKFQLDHLKSQIKRECETKIQKNERALNNVQNDFIEANKWELYKKQGEILFINLKSIPRGLSEISLPDPYLPDGIINIPLDPKSSHQITATKLLKKAARMQRAVDKIQARIDLLKNQQNKLQAILTQINSSNSTEELAKFVNPEKILSVKVPSKINVPGALKPKVFRIAMGWTLMVGKGPKSNDHLTFRIARAEDYWLHARDAGGAHCILQGPRPNSIPDRQTLLIAASIAAYFSRSRTSSKAPVDYTLKKYVRKPAKAPAGLVTITYEKTLMVQPMEPTDDMMIKTENS
jgi:predicted ribosome quality control (RQC) complex YloA/Tae2 family protein